MAKNCECHNKSTHIGTKQEEYAGLARYVYRKGVKYKAQAARLGLHPNTFSSLRKDPRYVDTVTDEHIEAFKQEFSLELAGHGQPTPLEQELATLKSLAEAQARRLANQEEIIAGLARILEDPAEYARRLAQVQAEIARLKEEE